nr:MAG TPA: hypothetical protein [Caudoviricetes sp.]
MVFYEPLNTDWFVVVIITIITSRLTNEFHGKSWFILRLNNEQCLFPILLT